MIDTLRHNMNQAVPAEQTLCRYGADNWREREFAVLTLHRPSNVDDPRILKQVLLAIREVSSELPVAFSVHPRTRARLEQDGLAEVLEVSSILQLPPVGYFEMLGLMQAARLVLTDSGGIQEETTALGVPCVTLRENTERPITVEEGTNSLVGNDPVRILAAVREIRSAGGKSGRVPELWDGRAAERIAAVLCDWLTDR
jgi:UDP-N-acetylglucosamine 2-epimerase (non-hydrolysing)